jgi:ribosome assembly protein YihI (activator of Der GTPase)
MVENETLDVHLKVVEVLKAALDMYKKLLEDDLSNPVYFEADDQEFLQSELDRVAEFRLGFRLHFGQDEEEKVNILHCCGGHEQHIDSCYRLEFESDKE